MIAAQTCDCVGTAIILCKHWLGVDLSSWAPGATSMFFDRQGLTLGACIRVGGLFNTGGTTPGARRTRVAIVCDDDDDWGLAKLALPGPKQSTPYSPHHNV